jgi:hypothetical protein
VEAGTGNSAFYYIAAHNLLDFFVPVATLTQMEQNALIFEAIALQRCVTATYNRMQVMLAPHILYTKHGELYVDAVTVKRDGELPREVKIGAFKLTGLKDLCANDQGFTRDKAYNPGDPKYDGVTLFAVTPD